jgi:glycerate kinase
MRIVIAPDKFKGCLTAAEVADAIAAGVRRALPGAVIERIPLADGGEGTVDALVAATAGQIVPTRVMGPLPESQVHATFALLGDGRTAVVEMAAASGLHLLRPDQLNPEATTTCGTGQLLLAARERGARKIILGIGGSATTDGGAGCAQACGITFAADGKPVLTPLTGGHLVRHTLTVTNPHHALEDIEILVACDVNNPLYGPKGAARVFGPQKGATPEQVERLDSALARLAQSTGNNPLAHYPGAGAAGGLGFGLLAFLGARIVPGFDLIAQTLHLKDRLAGADCVITGEGRLDASSLHGKTAIGVARLCKELNIPCIALVGAVAEGAEGALAEGITKYLAIADPSMPLTQAMAQAPQLLQRAAQRLLPDLRALQ